MTYYRSFRLAQEQSNFEQVTHKCFCCDSDIEGPTIVRDAFPTGDGYLKSVYMHRDCAFSMAQSLILDAWPHRRDEADMKTVVS